MAWPGSDIDIALSLLDVGEQTVVSDMSSPPRLSVRMHTPNGGQVAAVVVTSHGPGGRRDPKPDNHYSLLRTIQVSFGLGCWRNTCDTASVPAMGAAGGL